ncbi:hypothetical protein SRHO_G00296490 [Serrasalmus rhombeus]
MKERLMQEEKVTDQNSMEVVISVSVKEDMARRKHMKRKERRRAEWMKKLSPHRELSSRPEEEAQRWSPEESVIDGIQQESAVQELDKPEEKEEPKPSTPSPSDRSTHPDGEDHVRDESGAVPEETGPQPQAFTESEAEVQASETLTRIQTDGSVSAQTAEEKTAWSGHDGGGAVCIEVDTQQVEPAAWRSSGSKMLQRVLSSVQSLVQRVRFHFSDRGPDCTPQDLQRLQQKCSCEERHLGYCAGHYWGNGKVLCAAALQRPHVLQRMEALFPTPALRIIGRDSIKLQEILKKSSVSHQFDLRLGRQKVCKLDAELVFTYGSLGYGYSPQIKHAGRTMENLVENSLFPRCPPDQEQRDPYCNVITPSTLPGLDIIPSVMQQDTPRGTESRISAGLMDRISFIKA